jgi:hypothetical protein
MADKRPKYALDEDERPDPGALAEDTPERVALTAEQHKESQQAWAGVTHGVATPGQAKGFVAGALVWGAVGAVLVGLLGFIPLGDLALWTRLLVFAVVGALIGGTAGGIYLGGRQPELEGELIDEDGKPSVGTTLRDPHTDDHGHLRHHDNGG